MSSSSTVSPDGSTVYVGSEDDNLYALGVLLLLLLLLSIYYESLNTFPSLLTPFTDRMGKTEPRAKRSRPRPHGKGQSQGRLGTNNAGNPICLSALTDGTLSNLQRTHRRLSGSSRRYHIFIFIGTSGESGLPAAASEHPGPFDFTQ